MKEDDWDPKQQERSIKHEKYFVELWKHNECCRWKVLESSNVDNISKPNRLRDESSAKLQENKQNPITQNIEVILEQWISDCTKVEFFWNGYQKLNRNVILY